MRHTANSITKSFYITQPLPLNETPKLWKNSTVFSLSVPGN